MYAGSLKKDLKLASQCVLPRNPDSLDKISGLVLKGYTRIWWRYEEDEEDGELFWPYSGVVVPKHGMEVFHDEMEIEDIIIIHDEYPTEKCYPEVQWIAMARLLDDETLKGVKEVT